MNTFKSAIGFRRVAMLSVYFLNVLVGIWFTRIVLSVPGSIWQPFSIFFLLFGFVFVGIGIYGFVWDYKNVFSVVMDEEKLYLGRRGSFLWRDLDTITLHTTKLVIRSKNKSYKAIMLNFKNEKAIFLFDIMYANTEEMRAFLQEYIVGKK